MELIRRINSGRTTSDKLSNTPNVKLINISKPNLDTLSLLVKFNALLLVYLTHHSRRVIHECLVKLCKTNGEKVCGCLCEGVKFRLEVSAL